LFYHLYVEGIKSRYLCLDQNIISEIEGHSHMKPENYKIINNQ